VRGVVLGWRTLKQNSRWPILLSEYRARALDLDQIRAAIGSLRDRAQREAASENVVVVELFAASDRKPK
jgi:hypothetical protein